MPRDAERLDRIADLLKAERLDALVCSLPENVLLASSYWPVVGTSLAIVTRDRRVALIVPEDEQELADCDSVDDLVTFQPGSLEDLRTTVEAVREPFRKALRRLGLERASIGCECGDEFEPASYAGMHLYQAGILRLLAECLPDAGMRPADLLLARLKSVLTPIELDRLRRACRVAACAWAAAEPRLRAGLKEVEAAALFQSRLAIEGVGFEGVQRAGGHVACMSGPHSAQAHGAYARSRSRVLEIADLALVHCNSYADGYWTDITRTYSISMPEERQRRMRQAVVDARAAALAAIAPGVPAAEVDRAAREVLAARGFGDAFKHSTGHGVGFVAIDHNAMPRLHPASPDVLESGMVCNVEPAVYLDGYGGLRHCDVVAVTESGFEVLTPFPQNLEEWIR